MLSLGWALPLCADGGRIQLVEGGRSRVFIRAGVDSLSAGRRLAERIEHWTGVRPEVWADAPSGDDRIIVLLGTGADSPSIRSALDAAGGADRLGTEGYILRVTQDGNSAGLLACGVTPAGVHNAVSELVSWRLRMKPGAASVPRDLDLVEAPGLKYRIVWTSDGQANWSNSIEEMHTIQKGTTGTTVVPYTREGFLTHFRRNVDYLSDHKLNGCIIWGFLRDEHGGIEAGRDLSRYARERNVRILPGVCTQAAYGGFIYSQTHEFSLAGWLRRHPELCGQGKDGKTQAEAICPSRAENQDWLRRGTQWFFESLPDIGGVNLENGDLMECFTPDCVAAKSRPENDPSFFWDMMATQKAVVETAARIRPDAWLTFATYTGFREPSIRSLKGAPQYPPRFLNQYPPAAICQWTFTGLLSETLWPLHERPPQAAFAEHIGLLHQGSIWGAPTEPGRWWAAPGAMLDDCSTAIRFACARAKACGFAGVVLTGQTGPASPANELNFLAFEYFSWRPERTYEQFIDDRLAAACGGAQRARRFLALLRNTTRVAEEIEADRQSALAAAAAPDLEPRQQIRWRNLADELARRRKLAEDPATFKASP